MTAATARAATAIARHKFGLHCSAAPLPGELDLNFHLSGPDGDNVLKLSPVARRPVLDLVAACLRHIEGAQLSGAVPRLVVPTKSSDQPTASPPESAASSPDLTTQVAPTRSPIVPTVQVDFGGQPHIACAVTYVPGIPLADLRPRSMRVLEQLGTMLAELDLALDGFDHPLLDRGFPWRMETAPGTIRTHLDDLTSARDIVAATLERAIHRLDPVRDSLPTCVIHNDANDYNVMVAPSLRGARLSGLIDFGDVARGWRASEVAVAATYAMMGLPDPFAAACAVARGYSAVAPLTEAECAAIVPLVALRCCLSVCVQARQMADQPDNAYLAVSQEGAWQLLDALAATDWRIAEFRIREACGLAPNPALPAIASCTQRAIPPSPRPDERRKRLHLGQPSPVMSPEVLARPYTLDLSVASPDLPHPADGPLDRLVQGQIAAAGATVGIGRYGEARLVYSTPAFRSPGNDGDEARTIHLGIDLFAPAGTPVHSPLPGTVASVADNDAPGDYGPTVILRHTVPPVNAPGSTNLFPHLGDPPDGHGFHTLHGHLDRATLDHLRPGQRVQAGDVIGWLGDRNVNGGWEPHLHLQVIALDPLFDEGQRVRGDVGQRVRCVGQRHPVPDGGDQLGLSTGTQSPAIAEPGNYPGVALQRLRSVWEAVLPDPTALAGLPDSAVTAVVPAAQPVLRKRDLAARRKTRLGSSLSLSYDDPLHIVRGLGARLYDDAGRSYLDTVNNVPHVGHGNPRVAEAIARQSRILNTNTRYLHAEIVALADELLAHFPAPLEVVFLVCSGSEANELALRMARCHTGRDGVVCVEGAYHGNTGGLVEVSPYKFDGPGGSGPSGRVAVAAMPDPYRGRFRGNAGGGQPGAEERDRHSGRSRGNADGGDLGARYAEDVARAADSLIGVALPDAQGSSPRQPSRQPPPPGLAAFIVEPILSCGGQIEPPPGYLAAAFANIRARGGLCIADEVQVGFGRVGDAFWAFELQGVVPDIVTLGKPMGNGHPVAAVVTTREIADSFANGMEYFSTFGGNPVSCAAARAVLAEIRDKGLQEHARTVGEGLLRGLRELATRHEVIGDVRGRGLFLGIELVRDRTSREPFPEACAYLVNRARERGVLLSADGPDHNVIKIKPPLVFSEADGEELLETLDVVLAETAIRSHAK